MYLPLFTNANIASYLHFTWTGRQMLSRSPVREYACFPNSYDTRNQICPNGRHLLLPMFWQGLVSGKRPFQGGDALKRIINKFRRPAILQLNIEGLTASKMSILHHYAAHREALIILLQETHCTSAQSLVLPDYQLAGSFLSRKHGLATLVDERLK